ncbi:putative carboxylesterase 17 [Tasmannia lanceolata]|uniref:putative carboxylesterase 17 n=1 Tax=Tasmannia lanceolata TaxID=3420 RepID=UPI0040649247
MRRRMRAISLTDARFNANLDKDHNQHGVVVEEIKGLIRVYKDGHVERPPIVANVDCTQVVESDVASQDVSIDNFTGIWARIYVPKRQSKLPILIYFHGGGFCVGSAAWKCYHDFLSTLSSKANCLIMSVNYRLAPENPLPAAYDDGIGAVKWVRQQSLNGTGDHQSWWSTRCDFSKVFLCGDSAGGTIAYNVATRLGLESTTLKPLCLKGVILIQPFFGGEARTSSEKYTVQPSNSALSLKSSDVYWSLALPLGVNRDHQWCNPLSKGSTKLEDLRVPPVLVCLSEMDILKDRNLEFCEAMRRAGKRLEYVMYMGVGHSFQVLHNYPLSQPRTLDMISHIKAFINP